MTERPQLSPPRAAGPSLEELDRRMRAAARDSAPPQVVHALMLDVANEARAMGCPDYADRIEATASTLTPMFDMAELRARRWWRRSRLPDFADMIRHYREDAV